MTGRIQSERNELILIVLEQIRSTIKQDLGLDRAYIDCLFALAGECETNYSLSPPETPLMAKLGEKFGEEYYVTCAHGVLVGNTFYSDVKSAFFGEVSKHWKSKEHPKPGLPPIPYGYEIWDGNTKLKSPDEMIEGSIYDLKPEPVRYQVEFTADEAIALISVFNSVGGHPVTTGRGFIDSFSRSIRKVCEENEICVPFSGELRRKTKGSIYFEEETEDDD